MPFTNADEPAHQLQEKLRAMVAEVKQACVQHGLKAFTNDTLGTFFVDFGPRHPFYNGRLGSFSVASAPVAEKGTVRVKVGITPFANRTGTVNLVTKTYKVDALPSSFVPLIDFSKFETELKLFPKESVSYKEKLAQLHRKV